MDSFASELGTEFAVRVEAKHVIKKDQARRSGSGRKTDAFLRQGRD
jgi:hypothetical protein